MNKFRRILDKIAVIFQRLLNCRGFWAVLGGLLVVGVALRLVFLFVDYPTLDHDPASYFYNAESIIQTGALDESSWWGRDYIARFPHVFNYIWLLSGFMYLVGANVGAVLLLNSLFSVISAVLLYFLFKKGFKSHRIGLLAGALWFANPVEISFSAMALPLIVVNTCLIAGIFVTYLLLKNRDRKLFWVYAPILGIILGVANIFRPMMTVLLIALALAFVYLLIRKFSPSLLIKAVGGLAIAFLLMTGIQKSALVLSEHFTSYQSLNYYSGWSLLLGGNRESFGRWNEDDNETQKQILLETNYDWNAYDARLRQLAIERYRSFTFFDFPLHWLRKASILATGLTGSIHFELRDFPTNIRYSYALLSQIFYPFFLTAILLYAICYFIRARIFPIFVIFSILVFLGIFASAVFLTEVMDRYATPLMPLMFIIGLWGLGLSKKKPS